ncbi:Valencene synthase [Vitis vinifera]|uniref:Valencene synthase n=1 Tax=Vitis vinifera TaxID=29760 RepID=A0A438DCI1_VITVI|nr:Valencene synthase [Vitis vinifera]
MSSHLSAEVKRPVVSFRSSIWGNRFINYTPDDEITRAYNQQRVEDLKEEVKRELMVAAGKPSQHLNFIDAVQRLGMAYHFEEEIEEAIGHIYDNYHHSDDKYDDLCNVSLRFRLLRQQGYNISCDIFERFKDENGSFKECLNNDVEGMLGLYEAAHLRVQEEDILDEALAFTTAHLESLVEDLDYPLAAQATQALYRPIRKGLERLEARPHISIYQDEASHSKALLELAKLDFNLLQSLYKKELSYITRWWKDLDFSSKLPFVRDRVVETYLWIVAECFEPQYSYARRIQTKLLVLITVIDDVYDAYGTLEELELFTEAIERWDNNSIDSLPEYMKPCYQAVLDVYKEIEEKENEERPYCVHYAKKAVRLPESVRAYFNEGKWLHAEYVPTMEEYMGVALVSSDVPMFTIISFVGMGMMATKEAFDWFEQERGHSASSVECYMKQNSVSEQLAYRELNKQVEKAWKDINQEFLRPTAIPMHLLTRVLNFARTGEFMYKVREDRFTNVGEVLKDNIASLFIDPVSI